ncbi:MAG: hypothetical protein CME64_01140 [Halobacteriovoraceae bacterium]|nr:hypothetical protein [Halobacteriovoraceae bacterium]|tara:strand:+ start:244698 stop:245987 length:1290 start_codon:yes stop_codon:yes gene_type:complete
MKKLVLLVTMLFVVYYARANQPEIMFQPESSVPELGKPYKAKINKSFIKSLRVKVFPHTLKNDWVHGKADDASTVTLLGKNITFNEHSTNKITFTTENGKLFAKSGGVKKLINKAFIKSDFPVRVQRKINPDKSHSYNGVLEVLLQDNKILVINHINIEEYLKGVVPKESVDTWPLEALKAQAVAARSYAYYHLLTSTGKLYDVDDTARYQVYAGQSAQSETTNQAISDTRGEVLTHDDSVIVAFFHAYSGGRTDSALNIFGNSVDYCLPKDEIFSREDLKRELSPRSQWIVEWTTDPLTHSELLKKLKSNSKLSKKLKLFSPKRKFTLSEVEFNQDFDSVKTLKLSQESKVTSINFIDVRRAIGWSEFPSYHFRLNPIKNGKFTFSGSGWGHHVGLSQWGAFMMAKNYGRTHAEILKHYYSNVSLEKF